MPLRNRGGRAHDANGAGRRRGGLWRLLACTEGGDTEEGEETSSCISNDEIRRRFRTERRKQKRLKAAEAAEGRQKSGRPTERRRRRRDGGGSGCSGGSGNGDGGTTDKVTSTVTDSGSSGGGSVDERNRRQHRRRRRRRSSRCSGTPDVGEAKSLGKPRPGKSRRGGVGGGSRVNWRRPKRLVVAMLENGDEDGETATAGGGDGGGGGPGNLRLRATRDERKIRRILHQLSVTMDASEDQLAEFATLEIPSSIAQRSPKSPVAAATTTRTTRTSHTMTMQPSPMLQPQRPPLPPSPPPPLPPQRALQPPPPPHLISPTQPLPTTNTNSADPGTGQSPQHQQQGQLQGQHHQSATATGAQLLQQYQSQEKNDFRIQQCQQNQQGYGVSQYPQQPAPETTAAVRGTGRRGYRLFRRVFSAADNYYAVPFPPLEKIQLNKDDDQWEDLEIYVASHKGMVSINPKQKKSTKVSQKASAIPRPIADVGLKRPQQLPTKSAALKSASSPTKAMTAAGNQYQLPQKQHLSKPQTPRNPRANPLKTPNNIQFGYKHQQKQLLQHQQRRADPLSPSRLLSQLSHSESARRLAVFTQPSLPPPPPINNARASQLPVCSRWEPAGNLSRGSRYGKLSVNLP